MNKLADSLRAEAAAGEDFAKLQKEAFEAAGTKVANPTVNLPKIRRTGLPPAHAAVFDLKVGEVSAVISDNGGHYIYKAVSKDVLPLDQVKDEIRNKLKSERLKEMMDKYTNSFQATPNEAYFGAAAPAVSPGRPAGLPQQMQRPQMSQPPAQSPAQPPPPSNPN
jgi:parvulin-like peptidyl-prolyl isomerase